MVARACDLDRGSWAGENIGQSSKDGARLPLELEVSGQLIKGKHRAVSPKFLGQGHKQSRALNLQTYNVATSLPSLIF